MVKASAAITLSAVVDVERITRWYLLQSSTLNAPGKPVANPPGGSWDDTEPAYSSGSTNSLYFVDCNEFSDGSWDYSEVSLSSSYEAAKAAYNKANAAQTAADTAQSTADTAQSTANTASGKADAAQSTANTAVSKADQAQSDVNALATRVTTAETTITQTRTELALKASQATVDGLGTRLTAAETSLSLKADSATLNSTRDNLQSQIDAVPGQISLAVNDLEVGGTNLLKGTRQGFAAWEHWMNRESAFAWDRGEVRPHGSCRRYTCLANRLPATEASYSYNNISITGSGGVWHAVSATGTNLTTTRAMFLQTVTLPAGTYTLISENHNTDLGYHLRLYTHDPAVGLGDFTPSGTTITLDAETVCDMRIYIVGSRAYQTPVDITFHPVIRLSQSPTFLVWCYPTYVPLAAGQRYTLSTKVANYDQVCRFRYATSQDGLSFTDVGELDTTGLPGYADGYHTYTYSFTAPVTAYYRLGLIIPSFSGDIDLFDTWKLEQGEKATAWSPCPDDPVSNVVAGSTVTINQNEVRISTPLFSVDTHSDEGYLRVSPSGVETGHLSASNAASRYDGPASITVNANAASDGLSTFRTLTDALASLSGRWLDYDVTIAMTTNTAENIADLRGVYGRGSVTVQGGGHTLNGRLCVANCASVFFQSLTVACAGAVVLVYAYRVQSLVFDGCSLVGNSSANGSSALETYNSSVRLSGCSVYGVWMGICARVGGLIYINGCTGSCGAYALVATSDGKIGIELNSTLPVGSIAQTYSQGGGQIIGSGASSGGTAPTAPVVTTTATFSPSVTKTRNTASGWLTGTATLQQGLLGSGNTHVGALWFDLSSLIGKTVQSASLTLTRLKRFANGTYVDGSSGAVTVYAETATVASSASGSTGLGTVASLSEIGRVSPGSTVTMALPPAAVQAIVAGTAKALVVLSSDTALVSGKSYSANYAAFAGKGESGAPVLSVTYS